MKFNKLSAAVVAAGLAVSMAACSNNTAAPSTGDAAADGPITETTPGVVLAQNFEPQTGIIPAMINEVNGAKVADLIFAGLVYYDEKGETKNELAESLTTEDEGKTWNIKIKPDLKFTDGSPLTAQNFVDTWNWACNADNGALSRDFFSTIEGFTEDGTEPVSGLKVVSDTEFTVTLQDPDPDFTKRLGYTAFYPLPESALKDADSIKAFGQAPVANGPYKLDTWEHNTKIVLSPNPDYNGDRKPANKGIVFKLYTADDASYNDLLSNEIDIIDSIPSTALATFRQDLGDRVIDQPGAVWQSFTIPGYLPHFKFDDEGRLRRQAISMAINRKEITDTIFEDTRQPATDFIAPVIPGHQESLDGGSNLEFNPEKAKELWEQANAISPWEGTFELAYNADSSAHKPWVEAVCNQIKNALEISAEPKPYPTFKELREEATNGTLTSALRTGWQADYPSGYNFLGPIYKKGAGSNDARYDNPEFEEILGKAVLAEDQAAANKIYREAEEILVQDLPAIPLWDQKALGGFSDKVTNVKVGWNTVPLYWAIEKK